MKSMYRVVSAYERVRVLIHSHVYEKIMEEKKRCAKQASNNTKKKEKQSLQHQQKSLWFTGKQRGREREGERREEKMTQTSEFKKPWATCMVEKVRIPTIPIPIKTNNNKIGKDENCSENE